MTRIREEEDWTCNQEVARHDGVPLDLQSTRQEFDSWPWHYVTALSKLFTPISSIYDHVSL